MLRLHKLYRSSECCDRGTCEITRKQLSRHQGPLPPPAMLLLGRPPLLHAGAAVCSALLCTPVLLGATKPASAERQGWLSRVQSR